MIEKMRKTSIPALAQNKATKVSLTLVGALLVAAGFQGYSLLIVPPGVLAATGILIEVSLSYVFSLSTERSWQRIMRQRKEIDKMVSEVRQISREVEETKSEVWSVGRDVEQTKDEIESSQREIKQASETAEKAKSEIDRLNKEIQRAASKF